jgi:chromosome segregation ATPase
MSNEILLETLGETLRSLEQKREEIEARRAQYQESVDWYQQQLKHAEEQEQRAQNENGEIVRRMNTLNTHIASQQNPPLVLREKYTELQLHQQAAMRNVRSTMEHTRNMQLALQRAQRDVSATAQELAVVRTDWNTVTEQITNLSTP